MNPETVSFVKGIVANALELPLERVQESDSIETMEAWDSLGHLNILVALDKKLSGKVAKIPDFADATSIQKLADLLEQHRLI